MYIVNLFEKIGKSSIWGHETGKKFREFILEEWKKRDDELLIIDLKGIEIIDFSASSDLICIPISRLSSELLNKHIIIQNAEDEVRENINVALERQEICCINLKEDKTYEILGKCSDGLKNIIYQLYTNKRAFDSRQLADLLDTTVQVINNRITILYKLGMVKRRIEDAPTGGKQYIYESII